MKNFSPVSRDIQQFSDATARAYRNGQSIGYGPKATAPKQYEGYDRELQPYFEAGFSDGQIDYEIDLAD